MGNLQIGKIMRSKIALGLPDELGGVRRNGGQANEDHAGDVDAMHRLQPVIIGLEVRPHFTRPQQLAVQLVGPLVIGTDKFRGRALGGRTNPAATMAAGIVEGPDDAVGTAHNNDRIVTDLQRDIVAGLRQLC